MLCTYINISDLRFFLFLHPCQFSRTIQKASSFCVTIIYFIKCILINNNRRLIITLYSTLRLLDPLINYTKCHRNRIFIQQSLCYAQAPLPPSAVQVPVNGISELVNFHGRDERGLEAAVLPADVLQEVQVSPVVVPVRSQVNCVRDRRSGSQKVRPAVAPIGLVFGQGGRSIVVVVLERDATVETTSGQTVSHVAVGPCKDRTTRKQS